MLLAVCNRYQNHRRDVSKYMAWRENDSLVWTNFKGMRTWGDWHAAESFIWFDFYNKLLKDSIEVGLTTYFIPDSSWPTTH